MRLPEHVTIYEVGPRDGLQNEARQVPTADKLRFLGFGEVRIADGESALELARCAVDDLVRRSGYDLARTDLVIYGAGLGNLSLAILATTGAGGNEASIMGEEHRPDRSAAGRGTVRPVRACSYIRPCGRSRRP